MTTTSTHTNERPGPVRGGLVKMLTRSRENPSFAPAPSHFGTL